MDKSSKPVPVALFGYPRLYFSNGPAIPSTINGRAEDVYRWLDLRCKLIYRVAHRLAEIAQFLPPHSPLEGFAYISAGQTEVNVILIVGHRVLEICEPGVPTRTRGGNLLGP